MIAALQKSRSAAPDAGPSLGGGAPVPEAAPAANPGEMLIEKLVGLEAKLDTILKILGGEQQEEPAPEETAAKGELTE